MSTSALCISLLFSLFLFHGVGEVEASRRLHTNDRSRHFKLHYTLMNGVVSNNSELTPPLKDSKSPPPPNVNDTAGLVVTSGNQSQPPSELLPAESGGSSSRLPHVVVIVLLSFALIALPGLGIWLFCFKGRRHESANYVPNSNRQDAATMANGHTGSTPASTHPSASPSMTNARGSDGSVPAQPSAAPIVNGKGNGGPVRSHPSAAPPKANVQVGDGSVPAQPSTSPPKANVQGGDGSVPAQPSAPPPMVKVRGGDGSMPAQPSASPPMVKVRGGDGSMPAQPSAPPPMVKVRGGDGSMPAQPSAPPPMVKVRGADRSVPAQPSAPTIANGRGDGGSVPTPPAPAVPRERTDRRDVQHNASSHPAPKKKAPSFQLSSRHTPTATRVFDTPGPSRVADFGLIAFAYEELRDATDNFSQDNFLGEGGFAKVYKGSLSKNRKVAVKLLKNENSKAEREFQNEVEIISRARHINIVTLIGYCISDSKRLIVYEFVENKSLDDHLRGGKDLKFMDWTIRMKIAQGAAKGLAYVHEECGDQNIIHRDVKPANILLDSSFVAKVADFGISKLCPNSFDSYIATYVIGSVGFIDPFYYETKELSFKSDVYSFGVVLLELISGETHLPRVQELKNKIHRALKHRNFDTIADPKLENYNLDEMTLMVNCVEACLRKDPKDRPPMSQVSRVLEKVTCADELKMKTRPRRG